ncbi:putative transcription factor/ chromatin remodeling BED-type(Zn) family [Helianthus annuus]|nr:putative transcription factor/ chromatin remodeling BED-type(Zn) family [Helianthus annuus]
MTTTVHGKLHAQFNCGFTLATRKEKRGTNIMLLQQQTCVKMIENGDHYGVWMSNRHIVEETAVRCKMETPSSKTPVVTLDEETPNEPAVNVEETQESQEIVDQKKEGRAKKSWVWNHFVEDKDSGKSKCSYCNSVLASGSKKNGTSSLGHHLKFVCSKSPIYKRVDKKQSVLSFKTKNSGESSSLASYKFSQEKCRILLARMCIKDNQPFSIVDDEGFREYSWGLNPMFKFPSRWTVARDCWSIFREEKKKLKDTLKDQTVSLTTDTWTSVQNFNYMCLTAHWVDDDWVLRKKIINFCQVPNHKGETIGKFVYKCLQEWGIDRILIITVDNASSNDGAIRYLKKMLKGPHAILDCKYLHLRCNAHIINLVVKDGLEEQIDSINRIRKAVRFLRSSSQRFLNFQESVEKEKIKCKRRPCLDVETRWNSTFLMLETALIYEKAFDRC